MIHLGVNVDHVATIREARGTLYPDPVEAAHEAIRGGADQITIHLREDRRHIQEKDLCRMREEIKIPLNLEMAASEEIVFIACRVRPDIATLVPERRAELTTEGGLDVVAGFVSLKSHVDRLKCAGIAVSMFIDPDIDQIKASGELGADAVELHTGAYCDAKSEVDAIKEMTRLVSAAHYVANTKMKLCAGHGLNYDNTARVVRAIPEISEYNIGHAIVARAIFAGMERAVAEMKKILQESL